MLVVLHERVKTCLRVKHQLLGLSLVPCDEAVSHPGGFRSAWRQTGTGSHHVVSQVLVLFFGKTFSEREVSHEAHTHSV